MATIEQIIKLSEMGFSKDEIVSLCAGGAVDAKETTPAPKDDSTKDNEKSEEGTPAEVKDNTTAGKPSEIDFSKVEELKGAIDSLRNTIQESNRMGVTTDDKSSKETETVNDILSKMFK